MSRRIERFASLIRDVVGEGILARLNDPRIERLTSITRVDVSPDLSVARVHVSVMADEDRQQLCLRALRSAAGRLRAMLADHLTTRVIPQLVFLLDHSLQRGFATVEQLDRLMAEAGPAPVPPDASADAPTLDPDTSTPSCRTPAAGPPAARTADSAEEAR